MRYLLYIAIYASVLLGQEDTRTALFYATPSSENTTFEGHDIYYNGTSGNIIAEKFPPTDYPLYDDYMLERIGFYYVMVSEVAHVRVAVHHDSGGVPGNILQSWDTELTSSPGLNGQETIQYIQFDLESECNILNKENWYWLSISPTDTETNIRWIYSSSDIYTISTSSDNGEGWDSPELDFAGAAKIYGEAIYYPPVAVSGDVTGDNVLDILDIVQIIGAITDTVDFTDLQTQSADINQDGILNILDVVSIVHMVLNPPTQSEQWLLEDLNPESEYYGYLIGPETFQNNISCYYFGKAG